MTDRSTARVAFQEAIPPAGAPAPTTGAVTGTDQPPAGTAQPARSGTLDPNISALPGEPQIDRRIIGEVGKMDVGQAKGLADVLVASVPKMNESEAAGLPRDLQAYKIDMQQAWLLALMNGRYYQYQLEQLYISRRCR